MDKGYGIDLHSLMQFGDKGVFSKVLVKTETYNHTLMCLSAGADIDTHTSTKHGCLQIIKGTGEFILDDEKIEMKPGVFIHMPANAPHSLRATEDLAFLLCLVK